jgi:hypothetical protein
MYISGPHTQKRDVGINIYYGSRAELDGALEDVEADSRPNVLTAWLYDLAGCYSTFYDSLSVLKAEGAERDSRLALCDLTGRVLDGDVPDAVEASFAIGQRVRDLVFTLGLRHQQSLDGPVILGPGFVSSHGLAFTAVREINTTFETGLSLPLGPVTPGLGHARTVAGKNTPHKEVYALSAATSF